MPIDLASLPAFLAAVLLLMIIPGPDMIFVAANAIGGGRRAGFASLLGVASGAFVHIISAAIGLSALLLASPTAYTVVRFAGAVYLAWIGLRFLMAPPSSLSIDPAKVRSLGKIYLQGLMTNVLNPKAALFTLSFVPQFVSPEIGPVWSQMLIIGVLIVLIMVMVELPIVLASGWFSESLANREDAGTWLNRTLGALLIGLAAYVAVVRKA